MANTNASRGDDQAIPHQHPHPRGRLRAANAQQGSGGNVNQRNRDHVQYAIRNGRTQMHGVNLGGWLITEHWMTASADIWRGLPSGMADRGEQYAFRLTPRETAVARFRSHRDSFITEAEIAAIAQAGFNSVRVPVGYWIVGFDNHDWTNRNQWQNYAPNGLQYLDQLIRVWGRKYNIAVMISMHGAKGSQNGMDHSAPELAGVSYWPHYTENIASTLDAVVFLADRYKDEAAFLGIGLMNEPSRSTTNDVLYQYYKDAYQRIRVDGANDCILTLAPLLTQQDPWHMVDVLPDGTNLWVEWHRYFVWGFENCDEDCFLGRGIDAFRADVRAWRQHHSNKKLLIGEFSFASTPGTFWDARRMKEFGRRQLDVLMNEVDAGWAYWTWRTYEDEWGIAPWSLRNLVRNGVFPTMTTK